MAEAAEAPKFQVVIEAPEEAAATLDAEAAAGSGQDSVERPGTGPAATEEGREAAEGEGAKAAEEPAVAEEPAEAEEEDELENWQDPFAHLSLEELQAAVTDQQVRTDAMVRETQMFDRAMSRFRDADEQPSFPGAKPVAARQALAKKKTSTSSARRRSRNSSGQHSTSKAVIQAPATLTQSQKCSIAVRELTEARAEAAREEQLLATQVANLQAILAVQTARLEEVPRLRAELTAVQEEGAASSRSGRLPTEQFARHHERCMHQRATVVDKVELRSANMRTALSKVATSLRQKEEGGGQLVEVDFDQLRIENRQHKRKIDDKTGELLNLKVQAGRTNNLLNDFKVSRPAMLDLHAATLWRPGAGEPGPSRSFPAFLSPHSPL